MIRLRNWIPAQEAVGLVGNGVSDTEIECRDPSEVEGEPPGEPPGTVNRASYRLGGSLALQREPRPSAFPTVSQAGIHPIDVSRGDGWIPASCAGMTDRLKHERLLCARLLWASSLCPPSCGERLNGAPDPLERPLVDVPSPDV